MFYRHFSGDIYRVITECAMHSETGVRLVVYHDSKGKYFVRTYDMFHGSIANGVKRFEKIEHYECPACQARFEGPKGEASFQRHINSECSGAEQQRPPLGIIPRWLWDEQRFEALTAAIKRYTDLGFLVPTEWIEEYNELIRKKGAR